MADTRTKAQKEDDKRASNSIDFDHFMEPQVVQMYYRRKVLEEVSYSPDGYIYADGRQLRKWYLDLGNARGILGDIGAVRTRCNRNGIRPTKWVWAPNVLDPRRVRPRLLRAAKTYQDAAQQHWGWVQRLYETKTLIATIPDHDSQLSEYKVNILRIEPNHPHPDMEWRHPKEKAHPIDRLSYGFCEERGDKLKEGTKLDYEAGPLFEQMEENLWKLNGRLSRLRQLFQWTMQREVLHSVEARYGKKFTVNTWSRSRVEMGPAHEVIDLEVSGETYPHQVWYNLTHSYVRIEYFEAPGTDHYRLVL